MTTPLNIKTKVKVYKCSACGKKFLASNNPSMCSICDYEDWKKRKKFGGIPKDF